MIIVKCDEKHVYVFEDSVCETELEEELAQLKEFYKKVEVINDATEQLD